MHPFTHDFYGHEMSVLVLGYIRPELDYVSKGELVSVRHPSSVLLLSKALFVEWRRGCASDGSSSSSSGSWWNALGSRIESVDRAHADIAQRR
jgi:hypothetical protein